MADFKGTISLDIRDSKPDWDPFLPPKAAKNAPNVIYIVWDDVGIAAFSCFGSHIIETPSMDRLADMGVRFSQWHTTALCSPTRASLLTGRNCHRNGMACIVEGANGFPGMSAVIPPENGTLAEILRDEGWSTYAIGKWHLSPDTEIHQAASKRTWPTSRGFDRYYGFLGGESNQWYPDLVHDNHDVEQPYMPEDGYHLSKDLTDKAISFIADTKQADPDRPFFLFYAPGATHAPHHAPKEWIEKYKDKFDAGYEQYRVDAWKRMMEIGILPEGTELSEINPWDTDTINAVDMVHPWDSLNDDQKKLFARMAEVYAGYLSYTDHQIGRLLDYLEETGQLENTIFVAVSDNGASGEGTPDGSVNENKFFNNWPDDLQENLSKLDELGGPNTYNHYPTGWAWAFNTPFKMFKRYSLEGGIADMCIVTHGKSMGPVAGQIRHQYFHAVDVMPTILDMVGINNPDKIGGVPQSHLDGVSMLSAIEAAEAEDARKTQYYAMLGTRAIYHEGWKAVAKHGALTGAGHFDKDDWELYHIATDRTECHDVSAENPEKVKELVDVWMREAEANDVLPLDDRTAREQLTLWRPGPEERDRYVYKPGTSAVPESVAVNIRGRSFAIGAELENLTKDVSGVIFAHGSRFGGHSLYVKDGHLHYVYNFLGIEEQRLVSPDPLPEGNVAVGMVFEKTHEEPTYVANGKMSLRVGGQTVAEGTMRTQPGKFTLSGDGLCIGWDSADPVSPDYQPPNRFTGGDIRFVAVDVSGKPELDLEREFHALLARD
ncbi:arylsulfatase [Marivita hallyeonensis]|uniref:Arylsulfatase n=1 Tax=Marivita hallyeonensis TaxID=996342 RepID=A0A1M5MZ33_9RHOB|nr:arylsulfatase [Marivita hallyeonensis]SHG82023.1 arylsulfatase [Marivita hallyeonensis]